MSLDRAVRSNAETTYLGLVGSVEGAVVSRPLGYTLVRGPGTLSFCNFAIGFEATAGKEDELVKSLLRNAEERESFCAYCSSCDAPPDLVFRLYDEGFSVRQELVGMACSLCTTSLDGELVQARDPRQRLAVARFMARQFFGLMSQDAREAIALATALSGHKLLTLGEPNDPTGAAMLAESETAVGLYNLCVRPESRRHGTGSRIVEGVKALAGKLDRPVVLLCEPSLVSWYQLQKFEPVGSMNVVSRLYPWTG